MILNHGKRTLPLTTLFLIVCILEESVNRPVWLPAQDNLDDYSDENSTDISEALLHILFEDLVNKNGISPTSVEGISHSVKTASVKKAEMSPSKSKNQSVANYKGIKKINQISPKRIQPSLEITSTTQTDLTTTSTPGFFNTTPSELETPSTLNATITSKLMNTTTPKETTATSPLEPIHTTPMETTATSPLEPINTTFDLPTTSFTSILPNTSMTFSHLMSTTTDLMKSVSTSFPDTEPSTSPTATTHIDKHYRYFNILDSLGILNPLIVILLLIPGIAILIFSISLLFRDTTGIYL